MLDVHADEHDRLMLRWLIAAGRPVSTAELVRHSNALGDRFESGDAWYRRATVRGANWLDRVEQSGQPLVALTPLGRARAAEVGA